jgi:hypothetical protein
LNKKDKPSEEQVAELKAAKDLAELDFRNAKLAFYNRTEYKGQQVSYEILHTYAELLIARNYAYQKALYGTVKIKISVARLMRR